MKFSFFHLMPYTGPAEASREWPVPNVIGGALAYPTKRVRIAMMGNPMPLAHIAKAVR
ncbi:hypothetical protein LJR290_007942 [Variovorax sp. LjRoot290]|uniref:hypothetical protein n=1 Tax=Variovorax sp. LjRoot290 TaxID=3342316 RepID=UPI003ECD16BC